MIPRTAAQPPTGTSPASTESPGPSGARGADEAPRESSWQRSLRHAVRDGRELLELLGLDPRRIPLLEGTALDFPVRVPRSFVARMRPGDPADPLLLQVLPAAAEAVPVPGFETDPLDEASFSPAPGLLHKYQGRALLVLTGACAIHCRYCFRRHFPYGEHQTRNAAWRPALEYIASEPTLSEILLSGGDPLSLSDAKLASLADALAAIPHLERLRVHTRWPVVLPERVDDVLLEWVSRTRLQVIFVIHANHPREIDGEVRGALERLAGAGVALLNQAVLLRGVNDRVDVLRDLSESLFATGVMPYYLNLMDRVRGAAHFEVGEEAARELIRELAQQLPGYLVPRLVRESPGAPAKAPIPWTFRKPQDRRPAATDRRTS